jgi:NADPH:quinone reductase-like Zn-dependent oxidoreductase
MDAWLSLRYGPPESLVRRDVPIPVPGAHDILVRVHATTVSAADARLRAARVPRGFGLLVRMAFGLRGLRQPILGGEFAGDVIAVGVSVREFAIGDRVFGLSPTLGAHAEFLRVPARAAIAPVPSTLSFAEAAALPFGGVTMLGFYRRGALTANDRVLVNGAAGAVGSAAVQLAVARGAHVTAVCREHNADVVRSLGAHQVLDYERVDFASRGERYDLIVDAVGNTPYRRVRSCLSPNGRLLAVVADLPQLLHAALSARIARHRIVAGSDPERADDVRALAQAVTAGTYRPVIGHTFTFAELPDAHRCVDSGRKRGSAVVPVRGT